MLSRKDQGPIADWWWTLEKSLLYGGVILLAFGILLSFASSPSITARLGKLDSYSFVKQHLLFTVPSIIIMIALSFLSIKQVKRFSALLLITGFILLILTLALGIEVKGSVRWLKIFAFSLQPSEFIKPALIVFCAICFAEQRQQFKAFTFLLALSSYGFCALLLVLEPDIGQTMLLGMIWLLLLFLSGIGLWVIVAGLLLLLGGLILAYFFIPHVHDRIHGFITGQGNNFQLDMAREAILRGGWFGQGPGEGVIKHSLPDSHTDFVFAVAIEEYGLILSSLIIVIFALIVGRSLFCAFRQRDLFIKFAIAGLCALLGVQALINMAVNLHLLPAKGMTLPFLSYGGSSMISTAITMGLLLSLTRRRPEARAMLRPQYIQ